jgi:Icc-related predicted phosphoesterase
VTVHIVADVHGAHRALAALAPEGSTLLVLGDLVNLIDYRTIEGIIPDIVGTGTVREVVAMRAANRFADADALWKSRSANRIDEIRTRVASAMEHEYAAVARALARYRSYVTFGNVDDPDMLKASLPDSATYVDGQAVDIGGRVFGFVGGGVPAIGSRGEVDHAAMQEKLASLGPVDVLCTHVPPEIDMLATDLFGPRVKGSASILAYLTMHQPKLHFFGDVHQPKATRWQLGPTTCQNVGYFRATGRAVVID